MALVDAADTTSADAHGLVPAPVSDRFVATIVDWCVGLFMVSPAVSIAAWVVDARESERIVMTVVAFAMYLWLGQGWFRTLGMRATGIRITGDGALPLLVATLPRALLGTSGVLGTLVFGVYTVRAMNHSAPTGVFGPEGDSVAAMFFLLGLGYLALSIAPAWHPSRQTVLDRFLGIELVKPRPPVRAAVPRPAVRPPAMAVRPKERGPRKPRTRWLLAIPVAVSLPLVIFVIATIQLFMEADVGAAVMGIAFCALIAAPGVWAVQACFPSVRGWFTTVPPRGGGSESRPSGPSE